MPYFWPLLFKGGVETFPTQIRACESHKPLQLWFPLLVYVPGFGWHVPELWSSFHREQEKSSQ